ncbi:hypothetical protein M9H77_10959 [Catharanthus roseus]|uniref:Uncharacterized protein n=1 Tax=Catharanthus roseus TaxID=4058 RepID=A0ACC0BD43_CATRO|nr:hypothetical protein M9H77_10959 [Catharanthus roseus]
MRTRQYVVASTRNPDRRSDHVVSQLPKTLYMANFRAYHARLLTRNGIIYVRLVNFIVVVIEGRCLFNFVNDNTLQFNAIPHGFVESKDKPNELFLLQFHIHSHGIVESIVQKFWNNMTTHGI